MDAELEILASWPPARNALMVARRRSIPRWHSGLEDVLAGIPPATPSDRLGAQYQGPEASRFQTWPGIPPGGLRSRCPRQ